MNDNIIDKLSQLSELVEQRKKLKRGLELTKKEYVGNKVKMPGPKAEKTRELQVAKLDLEEGLAAIKKSIIVSLTLIIVAAVCIALCVSMGIEGFGAVWGVVGFVAAVLAFVYFRGFLNINSAYKVGKEKYAKLEAENNVIRAYNKTEFPKLIEKYNNDCIAAEAEYAELMENTEKALKEVEEKIENIGIDYPLNAYYLLDRVISILEDERADNIKEALNIARRDYREEERLQGVLDAARAQMASEYEEMSMKYAEKEARAEAEREARRREEKAEAERAAQKEKVVREMAAEKAEQARRKANSMRCAHCVNAFKCTYAVKENTDNCAAYRPRG